MNSTARLFVTSLFLLLSAATAFAQKNISINGHSENAAGRKVEILKYADLISRYQQVVDSATIDSEGNFRLQLYTNYPMMVSMRIENYTQSFYVEPAKHYQVLIPAFDWNLDERRNVFLQPETLPVVFQNIGDDDINILIDSIDRVIARFVDQNKTFFDKKFRPSAYYCDSLATVLDRQCPDGDNEFVNRYKRYQLAELRYNLGFDSRKNLINKYIKNQPILYHDENYMSLFASLYAYSISKGTKDISVYRLAHWVYNLDLDTYIDSIGTDPLLRDEQLRELAALVALKESFYDADYSRDGVRQLVRQLGEQTKWEQHRALAQRLLELFDRANEGSEPLRDVVLPDVDHRPVGLDSLRGKWLYISFVRANDANCQRELETMAHFRDTVYSQGDVEFISIDCDREFQKMYHLLRNNRRGNNYRWLWLHFDGDYHLLERLGVVAFPTFLLVDPQGNRVYDYTPAPESGFLLHAPWQRKDAKKQ